MSIKSTGKGISLQSILKVLKKLPTKKDVKTIVKNEIFENLTSYHADMVKPEFDKINGRLDKVEGILDGVEGRLDGVEGRLDKIETNVSFIKHDISDIKADFSQTPTFREFNELKSKVDRHIVQ